MLQVIKLYYFYKFSKITRGVFVLLFSQGLSIYPLLAQKDSLLPHKDFELSVEDMLETDNTQRKTRGVVSLSRREESIFEAPFAASVITREEIVQSGALSIPEALRLLPGVIVRETSAGNFDVNIRGLNNLPPNGGFQEQDNRNSLVMIDGRPVYNYFSGGTFWETLPVSIQDIEKIELVRGPVSALYGPNAVTGAINIITRYPETEGAYTNASVELGNQGTLRASNVFGFRFGDRLSILGSANITHRDRQSDDFYSLVSNEFAPTPVGFTNYLTPAPLTLSEEAFASNYPNVERSIERLAMNAYVRWLPLDKAQLDLKVGFEESQVIRPYAENGYTPHSQMRSESWYVDLFTRIGNNTFHLSRQQGEQEPGINVLGLHYNFNLTDAEYNYFLTLGNLNVEPGLNYRRITYDDTPYQGNTGDGFLNASRTIEDVGASLRLDYKKNRWRIIGAIRADKFNFPNDWVLSYQTVLNYNIDNRHLFWAMYGSASRSPFMLDMFTNIRDESVVETPGGSMGSLIVGLGNTDLKLFNTRSMEVGYRFKPNDKFQLALEGFYTEGQDLALSTQGFNFDNPDANNAINILVKFENIDLIARQLGFTFSAEYKSRKIQLRPFVTWQQTNISNFSPFITRPDSDPTGAQNTSVQSDIDNYQATPTLYGGFLGNYLINQRFSINLNAYFFTNQVLTNRVDNLNDLESNPARVKGKAIVNMKVLFKPVRQLSMFVNLRNLLAQNSFEYYYTDTIGTTFTVGFNYEF